MHDDDLAHGFDVLSRHVASAAHLPPPAELRKKADRRRTSRRAAGATTGVLVVGAIALALTGTLTPDAETAVDPAAPIPTSAAPSPSPTRPITSDTGDVPKGLGGPAPLVDPVSGANVLDGTREVALLPEATGNAVRATAEGTVSLTINFDDDGLFVLVPKGSVEGEYLVKTGRVQVGGEPSCRAAPPAAGKEVMVIAAACDTSDAAQVWRITPVGESDCPAAYTLMNNDGLALGADTDAQTVLARTGEGLPFLLPDQGPQQLPTLG